MYLGEYKDGKFHGQGTFIWNDGYYHEGEYKEEYQMVRELKLYLMDSW